MSEPDTPQRRAAGNPNTNFPGRVEQLIELLQRHRAVLEKYEKLHLTIDCAGLTIHPMRVEFSLN